MANTSVRRPVVYHNRAYFVGSKDEVGQVLVFDGRVQRELCRLLGGPSSTAAGADFGAMGIADGQLYVALSDGTTMYVHQVDPTTGAARVIGTGLTVANEIVTDYASFNGRLFVATAGIGNTHASHIYSIDVERETAWTTERTTSDLGGTKFRQYTSLKVFGGKLYATTSAPAGFAAIIEYSNTTGTWTTDLTSSDSTNANNYDALVTFNGFLYAMYNCPTTSSFLVIKQTAAATWSTSKDMGAAGSTSTGMFRSTPQILYAVGPPKVFTQDTSGTWATSFSDAALTYGLIV